MAELIFGSELLEKYNITPNDLFIYIQRGELSPRDYMNTRVCRPDRKPPKYIQQLQSKIESLEQRKSELRCKDDLMIEMYLKEPFPAFEIKQIEVEINAIASELKSLKTVHSSPYDWKNYQLPENTADAVAFLRFLCSCYFIDVEIAKINNGKGLIGISNQKPPIFDNSNRKNLLPAQRHRLAVISIAQALWVKDPTITIADMILRDDINSACEGKVYSEKTLRNWIKGYCPDRSPGRRSKTQKR